MNNAVGRNAMNGIMFSLLSIISCFGIVIFRYFVSFESHDNHEGHDWTASDHPGVVLHRNVCVFADMDRYKKLRAESHKFGFDSNVLKISFPNKPEQICNSTERWQVGWDWIENCGHVGVAQRDHPVEANKTWITERTLYPYIGYYNIAHFYYDQLWNLFPESKFSEPSWSFVWMPWLKDDVNCTSWICNVFAVFEKSVFNQTTKHLMVDQGIGTTANSLLCFEELMIPKFSMYRPVWWNALPPEFRWIHGEMRQHLTQHFDAPKHDIVFYVHNDSYPHGNRVWTNGREIAQRLRVEEGITDIKVFDGFYGLSVEGQCRVYYDADIIVGTHGAHTSNTVCARPGTLVVEMACATFPYWSACEDVMWKPMGLEYHAVITDASGYDVPPGTCLDDEQKAGGDFSMRYEVVRDLVKEHLIKTSK